MVVLGIDPGLARVGYGVIDRCAAGVVVLDYGCIETSAADLLQNRLLNIYNQVAGLITLHRPEVISLEMLFIDRNTRSGAAVMQARGVLLLCAGLAGVQVVEYTPTAVKRLIGGSGRARKADMLCVVKSLLALPQLVSDDVADALAVALLPGLNMTC